MKPTVLVTGATGKQGFATVRHLLAASAKVHAVVRDRSSPVSLELERLGAKICPGTFDDLDSLRAAAVGTTAVFLNVSPTINEPELELRHAKNIIQAAKEAGTVDSIVYSSVTMTGKHESFPNWGPDYPMGWYWTSKAEIESHVRSAGFTHWTILRPAFLMYNYVSPVADFMFPELSTRHTFLTAYNPGNAMTVFDPDDLGKFAAAAFLEPETYNHEEIDLGVEALTPKEITQSLTNAAGKDIKTEFYPAEEAAALSKVNPVIRSQLWANEVGYKVDFEALKKYPIKLTTFDEYLQREKGLVHKTFD
ncbi:uncharacterized protein BHQ10_005317 [Talaromyces amestolkiae]|uniref:NmrA-like domain-containing protein n=1 Tax=Talaromyces amestolkiae TaxID=1196081 RepID=A0A364L0I4_TALAM|nr:uncharacterized protein BHQ10_005317 [Talaromyces amestolkiae]RAO69305.1 hypothetical protein BHQ10_005317 [Talaromyces amestolkiae]